VIEQHRKRPGTSEVVSGFRDGNVKQSYNTRDGAMAVKSAL